MNPNWSKKQFEIVETIADLWARGLTQERIAEQMGRALPTLRSQLVAIGVKFGRAGKLVWTINEEPIDVAQIEKSIIESAA